jgi:hypothetical protein
MDFKKASDYLWPVGATVLGLLVMPLAIEQYPEFFKENRWPLPVSVVIVLACWILPFVLHDRAKRFFQWTRGQHWGVKVAACVAMVLFLAALYGGGIKLFRFHSAHLQAALRKKENKEKSIESKKEPSPEPEVPRERKEAPKAPVQQPLGKKEKFLGFRSMNEKTVLGPGESAILYPGPNRPLPGDLRDTNRLIAEEKEAIKHLNDPDRLTVRDLFWTDFTSPENTSVRHGGFTIRNNENGVLTHIGSVVVHQLQAGFKSIALYILDTNETPHLAVSLANFYKQPLEDYMEGAIETAKAAPGDSAQLSSKDLVLSNRVFVYHETYLSPQQIAEAENVWKAQGVVVVFRGPDYLQYEKMEITLKRAQGKK